MKTNCRQCIYFKITWDPKKPYGCAIMEFKSKFLPGTEVYEASGRECLKFEVKRRPQFRKIDRRF